TVRETQEAIQLRVLVEQTVEESGRLIAQSNFDEPMRLVEALPDTSDVLIQLKESLAQQIAEARRMSELRTHVESIIETAKGLVRDSNFAIAKQQIHELPDEPADLGALKGQLINQ